MQLEPPARRPHDPPRDACRSVPDTSSGSRDRLSLRYDARSRHAGGRAMVERELYEQGEAIRRQLRGDADFMRNKREYDKDPVMKKFIDVATDRIWRAVGTTRARLQDAHADLRRCRCRDGSSSRARYPPAPCPQAGMERRRVGRGLALPLRLRRRPVDPRGDAGCLPRVRGGEGRPRQGSLRLGRRCGRRAGEASPGQSSRRARTRAEGPSRTAANRDLRAWWRRRGASAVLSATRRRG